MKDYKYRYLYIVLTERSSLTNGLPGMYIGQHSTNNLNDGYIGSGKLLKKYLQNHPNKFERHILSYYNSKEELDKAEYEMIHDILGYPNVLNLMEGGKNGSHSQSNETRQKISISLKARYKDEYYKQHFRENLLGKRGRATGYKWTVEQKYNLSNKLKGHICTSETKQKISNANKGHKGYMTGKESPIKGKHKVWDNKELNIFHFE